MPSVAKPSIARGVKKLRYPVRGWEVRIAMMSLMYKHMQLDYRSKTLV
jgi:hypothetical protein